MSETKFKQCSCAMCGKKLPCLEYTGADCHAIVCCSKRCFYYLLGYDEDELADLESRGELDDDFGIMEVEDET